MLIHFVLLVHPSILVLRKTIPLDYDLSGNGSKHRCISIPWICWQLFTTKKKWWYTGHVVGSLASVQGFSWVPCSSVFLGHGFFLGTWYHLACAPSKMRKWKDGTSKGANPDDHHSFSFLDPIRNHPSSQGKAQAQYEVCRRVRGTIVRITFGLRYCIVAVWCITWFGFHGWYVESMDSHGVPSCWEWLHSWESNSIWPNVLAILPVSLRF